MLYYDYSCEISELIDNGMSYEQACAWCKFVCGEIESNENEEVGEVKRTKLYPRTKKWLEKTAKKTISST